MLACDRPDTSVYEHLIAQVHARPPLGHQRNLELARRRDRGDRQAWEMLVEHNLGLAVKGAHTYRQRLPIMEAVQEAIIGLMRAADLFDPDKGFKFSTYAMWWIRQSVTRADQEKARLVRVPHDRVAEVHALRNASRELDTRDPDHLAQHTGIAAQWVRTLLPYIDDPRSLDAPSGGTDDTDRPNLGDTLADPAAHLAHQASAERREIAHVVHEALERLPETDRRVLRIRYGLDGDERTLEQVGRDLGVSKERARQIERRAIDKLRDHPTVGPRLRSLAA